MNIANTIKKYNTNFLDVGTDRLVLSLPPVPKLRDDLRMRAVIGAEVFAEPAYDLIELSARRHALEPFMCDSDQTGAKWHRGGGFADTANLDVVEQILYPLVSIRLLVSAEP